MSVEKLDFESLVNAHYQSLYRFALSLTHSEADACDLVQDTFYTYATKGKQVRDKSKIKSWLFTTLSRKFLGIRRHDTRFPHVEVSVAGASLPSISPTTVNDIDGTTAVETLMEIDEIYRAPLVLFYLQEHSYKEIAEILEIPAGTVMSRIARGKEALREKLAVKKAVTKPESGSPNIVNLNPNKKEASL